MDFSGLFEDDTWALLGRVVFMTMVYAALAWVPLRGTTAIVRRVQGGLHQREQRRRPRKPRSMHADW